MQRRDFLKNACLSGVALPTALRSGLASPASTSRSDGEPLRVLHITDVHIRPEERAPERCETLLRLMRREAGQVDLVLNTGDSIYAADYADISRERMLLQWDLWDSIVMREFSGIEVLSCLGNHDSWWAAPTEDDRMRGKSYAVERLGSPGRYYAVDRGPWKIIALDSNNQGLFDTEQRQWLDAQFAGMPDEQPVLIMSHQPVLNYRALWDGMALWQKQIIDPLHETSRRVAFISGHTHELDSIAFHNLSFYCNGAFSGFWWEPGPENDGSRNGTQIGYAVLELFPDGRISCNYHGYTRDELLVRSRPEGLKPR